VTLVLLVSRASRVSLETLDPLESQASKERLVSLERLGSQESRESLDPLGWTVAMVRMGCQASRASQARQA